MVKKLKKTTDESQSSAQLAGTVKESAQQIWLAGLGAFAKAQEEGAKVFDALVKEGKGLEEKTRKMTQDRVGGMSEQMNKAAQTATAWGSTRSSPIYPRAITPSHGPTCLSITRHPHKPERWHPAVRS